MSYVPGTTKWGTDSTIGTSGGEVTWSANYFDALSVNSSYDEADFDAALQNAFTTWESVASIDFVEVPSDGQITIGSMNLGAGVAGLASIATIGFPSLTDVDVFFATSLTWAPEGQGGDADFFAVALHEIGHAIGLEHVNDKTEIMNPTIFAANLGNGDIAAAQYLYGRDVDDAPSADAEQVSPPSTSVSSSGGGGGGGGAIAAVFGLLALLFGFLPGSALALAAGKLADDDADDGESDSIEETVALADFDFADFLPTIPVTDEHVAYLDQWDEGTDDQMPFLL